MFGSKKCGKCSKSIYHNDPQLALGGKHYHKSCARCATCNGYLSIKNFSTSGERLLCKTHFKEEFSQTGGVYAGDDKFKQSGSRAVSRCNSIESGGNSNPPSRRGSASSPVPIPMDKENSGNVTISAPMKKEEIEVTSALQEEKKMVEVGDN